jgi:hypothetical protein
VYWTRCALDEEVSDLTEDGALTLVLRRASGLFRGADMYATSELLRRAARRIEEVVDE